MYYTDWSRHLMGYCKFCGAPAYYNFEEDKITFENPELGCLCYIEEEDYEASNFNRKNTY